jgi:hypothetical protein
MAAKTILAFADHEGRRLRPLAADPHTRGLKIQEWGGRGLMKVVSVLL